jgi:hypothetical protein
VAPDLLNRAVADAAVFAHMDTFGHEDSLRSGLRDPPLGEKLRPFGLPLFLSFGSERLHLGWGRLSKGGLFHFYPLLAALAARTLVLASGELVLTIMCLSHARSSQRDR